MTYETSQLYQGMSREFWTSFTDDTEVSVLDYEDYRERYIGVVMMNDTVFYGKIYTGTDRGPLEVLSIRPWGLAERTASYEDMMANRQRMVENGHDSEFAYDIPKPVAPKGPISRAKAEAEVEKLEQNREKVDAYYGRNKLGRAWQAARMLVGKTSDCPTFTVAYNANFPDVMVISGIGGVDKEVLVSLAAEETYRSLPERVVV